MKCEDIIKQLQAVLPSVTDLFTENFSANSITYVGGVVTVVTAAPHGLSTNDFANIVGTTNPIASTSADRSGTVITIVTDTDHDLTLSAIDIKNGGKTVTMSGANEAEFNGEFNLLEVKNRRTFDIETIDAGPLSATGSPVSQDISVLPGFNGRHQVTVIDATTFTYPISATLFASAGGTPVVKPDARISGSVTFDIAEDAYTKQGENDLWAFVVLGDVIASKNRDIQSDLTDTAKRVTGWRQRVGQPFTVYVFTPSVKERAGRSARDLMEDVSVALFRSLLGAKFNTGYYASNQYVTTFINHGFTAYTSAYYVHEFNFEVAADITFEDTVGYEFDTAFRDIELSITPDFGTHENPATANIDLDEDQLP